MAEEESLLQSGLSTQVVEWATRAGIVLTQNVCRLESVFVLYEPGIVDNEQFQGKASICNLLFNTQGAAKWLEQR